MARDFRFDQYFDSPGFAKLNFPVSFVGFFAYPMYVINQLLLAEKFGLIGEKAPFVYMPEKHQYHQCSPASNFWTRWFKPISGVDAENIQDENDVWEFSTLTIESLHYNKDAVHTYPYEKGNRQLKGDAGTFDWLMCHRDRVKPIMDRYIRIKPDILEQAKDYFAKHLGVVWLLYSFV